MEGSSWFQLLVQFCLVQVFYAFHHVFVLDLSVIEGQDKKSLGDLQHGLHLKGKGTCALKSVTGVWESHCSCKQPSNFTLN